MMKTHTSTQHHFSSSSGIYIIIGCISLFFLYSIWVDFSHPMASNDNGEHSIALITVPNDEVASKLIKGILEEKLAACVNKVPKIESSYWWKGKIETDTEHLLILKTMTKLVPDLISFVKKNH